LAFAVAASGDFAEAVAATGDRLEAAETGDLPEADTGEEAETGDFTDAEADPGDLPPTEGDLTETPADDADPGDLPEAETGDLDGFVGPIKESMASSGIFPEETTEVSEETTEVSEDLGLILTFSTKSHSSSNCSESSTLMSHPMLTSLPD